jgi:catechol 2,3-dioxygenase-like lactoylglutathione lyase family enzyme
MIGVVAERSGSGTDGVVAHQFPPIDGLHHIRIPVTDAWRSRDWYMILGFAPLLDFEEEKTLVGVVLRHRSGLVVGLHQDPVRAEELRGFALLGLAVSDQSQLERWAQYFDGLGIAHRPLEEGHLGFYLDVPDPDGIVVRFHSGPAPSAEEA